MHTYQVAPLTVDPYTGDFFTTRHSNLPQTQIVFHLVIDDDGIYCIYLVLFEIFSTKYALLPLLNI